MPADEYEGEFTESDVRVWSEGHWYFVSLAGDLLARRYSRSGMIAGATVNFNATRSPRWPRTRGNLCYWSSKVSWLDAEGLSAAMRRTPFGTLNRSNRLVKPLEARREHHP